MSPLFHSGDKVKFARLHPSHNDTARRMFGKIGVVEDLVVDDLGMPPRYYVKFDDFNIIWIRERYLEGAGA